MSRSEQLLSKFEESLKTQCLDCCCFLVQKFAGMFFTFFFLFCVPFICNLIAYQQHGAFSNQSIGAHVRNPMHYLISDQLVPF